MIQHTPDTMQAMLGARVRMLRKSKKLSKDKLAELANVAASTITNIESGAGTQMNVFLRVLDALGALSSISCVLLEETRPTSAAIPAKPRTGSRVRAGMGATHGWDRSGQHASSMLMSTAK